MASGGINEYIAGGIGGAAGLIVGHPFDTTKVQLQTRQTSSPYRNTWEAIRNINSSGLARGFFRGLGFPLVSYGVVNSVFFGVYGNTLRFLVGDKTPSHSQVLLAGGAGGFVQLSVAVPVDVVKVVLQSQIGQNKVKGVNKEYFKGPWQCLTTLYKLGGLRACYKGLWIQGMRDIPASAAYFLIYESMFDAMTSRGWSDKNGVFASLWSGGWAGVLSWFMIMPLDVVKSQIQADLHGTKYKGIIDCATRTFKECGLKGLYKGSAVTAIRAFLVNGVIFVVHNQSMRLLQGARIKESGSDVNVVPG